jgi:hypothetical protein
MTRAFAVPQRSTRMVRLPSSRFDKTRRSAPAELSEALTGSIFEHLSQVSVKGVRAALPNNVT